MQKQKFSILNILVYEIIESKFRRNHEINKKILTFRGVKLN